MLIKIPQYVIRNSYISGNNIFQLGFKEQNEDIDLYKNEDGYLVKSILEED